MNNNLRTILQLVALGRITPIKAERLLIAWNDGRESLWALSACVLISLFVQFRPHQWLPELWAAVRPILSIVNHLLGGVL
jgi:hypothetical protein